ncbi:MAG: hypothetical protein ACPL7A_02010 [Anaerolineales bacterium]
MQSEQILKKLDWLDEERRKDKTLIVTLEDKIKNLEENLQNSRQQIKELSGELARFKSMQTRVEQTDEALLKYKIEVKQQFDELEKETRRREEEAEKVRRVEIKSLDTGITELRKEISGLGEIRRSLQTRLEEEIRLSRAIEDLKEQLESVKRNDEEFNRLIRQSEENRRQDSKRITDLIGEINSLRKVYNELAGQFELYSASLKKIENRMAEVETGDAERKQAQIKFIEEQALIQVERERTWKEWAAKLEQIEALPLEVERSIQNIEIASRNVNRAQQAIDELAQKVERRVAELTELQRLGEERIRQEWVAYKSDDQKRWTNYTLVQEEMRNELLKQIEKILPRLLEFDERIQTLQDVLQIVNEQTERHLREVLGAFHNWALEYEEALKQR